MVAKRKQYKREQRLQSAKGWLKTYAGNNIVKGYRQQFGVDWNTAFAELEMLGVQIDPEYKKRVQEFLENEIEARQRKHEEKLTEADELMNEFQDDNFAFIIGYTSGGAPYGITWAEWDKIDEADKSS